MNKILTGTVTSYENNYYYVVAETEDFALKYHQLRNQEFMGFTPVIGEKVELRYSAGKTYGLWQAFKKEE